MPEMTACERETALQWALGSLDNALDEIGSGSNAP